MRLIPLFIAFIIMLSLGFMIGRHFKVPAIFSPENPLIVKLVDAKQAEIRKDMNAKDSVYSFSDGKYIYMYEINPDETELKNITLK